MMETSSSGDTVLFPNEPSDKTSPTIRVYPETLFLWGKSKTPPVEGVYKASGKDAHTI